jgi:hypothetical protein
MHRSRTTQSQVPPPVSMERQGITPRSAARHDPARRRRARIVVEQLEPRLCLSSGGTLSTDGTSPETVPMPPFAAGSILTITATLTTSDQDENGEGEALLVQSSGGFSATISDFSSPHVYQYRATQANETFTVSISSADSDESAVVNIDINANSKQRYTDQEKADFNKLSADWNIAAAAGATIAAGALFAPDPTVTKVVSGGFGVGAGVAWLIGSIYARMAADPSDPNFTALAQPSNLPYTPLTAQAGLTQAEANALNALYSNEVQMVSVGEAVLTTINRAQGASDAGNPTYENMQLQHLQQLDQQLGSLTSSEAGLRSNLTSVFAAAGVNQAVQSSDVYTFEGNVASGGLPDFATSELNQLGATSAEIAQITQTAIVTDTSQAAGNYPAMLGSSTMLADLQAVTTDLQQAVISAQIAPSSLTGLIGPPAATSVNNPTVTGTAPAGTTIKLFAQASNQSTPSQIGQTTANSNGQWSITAGTPLADGTYVFSMNVVSSDGSVLPSTLGTVVIDTTAPDVTAVTYNKKTGQVSITFQDSGPSGFDLSSLRNLANYAARTGKSARSRAYQIGGLTISPGSASSSTETVTFNLVAAGKSKRVMHPPKSFYLTIHSGGVRNAAGDALSGAFNNALPSGNGHAGGDFVALVPIKIKATHHHGSGGKKK